MTTEAPRWGAPPPAEQPPPGPRWTVKRIVVAVAVAVGIAAAGGVAIYAASGSVDNRQAGPNGAKGGPMMLAGPMGAMEGTDHGEFQSGKVTALTDDSITAQSADGYTKTYTVDDDTRMSDDLAKGDEVMIVATTEGDTTTAESVMEQGTLVQHRDGRNRGNPPGGDN